MATHSDGVDRLIGAFKLVKASLLTALGVAGFMQTPSELNRRLARALAWLGLFPGRHTVHRIIDRLLSLDHGTEIRLAILSLAYAAVFLVEGVGLLRRRRWAEWMTVAVTASFIPLEIYELITRASAAKVVALALNVAIAAYLVWRRIEDRRSVGGRLRRAARLA